MVRKKLKPSAFTELNQCVVADVPTTARWQGYRVLAAESITLMLPSTHPDTRSANLGFNCYHYPGGFYSLARGAGLCDTATGLMLRADIASDARGERDMLVEQLAELKRDDLLVLDRGYPAYWLFALLNQRGHAFCMRLSASFNAAVKRFVASGRTSTNMTITPDQAQHQAFKQREIPVNAFSLRLVRVLLPSGQIEVLATNLLDEAAFPAVDFAALYHRRWRIEEAFRHLKSRLKLEQFGGETPLAIQQEFHAAILLHNLATLAAMDALTFGANLTHASHLIRLHLPSLLANPDQCASLCELLLEGIAKKITRRRLGRRGSPRKPDRKKPHPHHAYK